MAEVDSLIREALRAEDVAEFDRLAEPGLPEMVIEVFRGRMRLYGALFLLMITVFFATSIYCGVQFLRADDLEVMARWGAGFFLSVVAVIGGKLWYWMQLERIALIREVKRVELLVAQLALELRSGSRSAG